MQLLPAIDLRHGQVVRLYRGDDRRRTVYDLEPAAVLGRYAEAGVERVHVVDLDAAFGEPPQRELIAELASLAGAPVLQLGGGLRRREAVEWAFAAGCERLVLTSLLVRDFDLFASLAESYPERLVPALDLDAGRLKTAGWTEQATGELGDLFAALAPLPLAAVLVTDIARDGTLEGPNLDLARQVSRDCHTPALLSGGVSSLADLEAARGAPEIAGAIVGRALYDGRIDLAEALAVCSGSSAAEVEARRAEA